ncbi:DUF4433 domain-containing protein [Marinagarivorans cellulosilyticus]|uniref:DarT domain-containing protein n=1 Tax=Marinagarivorans cellulosilyticus TaxID=2721545 RepID=A0AAN2BIF3_9GAMM|nr:DUF4433 domain-containing protein [Marinagarivorans cellulosilyticus]BCD95853.1 hypothetical protein MARGE09_P0052 [Marinagarivorans cellulosilyticus]
MCAMPVPVRLFHITAIDNLAAIFSESALLCKTLSDTKGLGYHNIAHAGAQGTRAGKAVIDPPGGGIHDYVPFYFAPRSPMLSAIHHKQVAGCPYRQADIVYFELLVRQVVQKGAEFVFYDRNATKNYSVAYTDPHQLKNAIDWELLTEPPTLDGFCKFFHDRHEPAKYLDRREKRQAEFLIKDSVPVSWFTRLGVIDNHKASIVQQMANEHGVNLAVDVMPDWYF